ncbi:Gfo/Idh/MocA family protein [Planctomycetota bacterium]
MKAVRIGIIGCGVIGKTHAAQAAALEETELVGVTDLNQEAAQALADRLEVPRVYASAEEMLSDTEIEAVVLALPSSIRTALCLQAFEQGKHVLNEKPLSQDPEETDELLQARGDLTAACCVSRLRFTKSFQAAFNFVKSGALGELRLVRIRALQPAAPPPTSPPPVWRFNKGMNAGGIMSNWGCYDLDYLLGLLDWQLKPVQVLARTWNIAPDFKDHIAPGSDAETHVSAFVTCENGPVIMYERGEQIGRTDDYVWEITGTGGTLHFDIVPKAGMALRFDQAVPEEGVVTETVWEGDDDWEAAHRGPLQDFARAIREKREPLSTFEQAGLIQKITHAIYASSDKGETVSI